MLRIPYFKGVLSYKLYSQKNQKAYLCLTF